MAISYQIRDGIEYAKDPGVSVREGNTVRKKDVVYLGRVIDKDKNIFCNKKRGVFRYDEETHTFHEENPAYYELLLSDKKQKKKRNVYSEGTLSLSSSETQLIINYRKLPSKVQDLIRDLCISYIDHSN